MTPFQTAADMVDVPKTKPIDNVRHCYELDPQYEPTMPTRKADECLAMRSGGWMSWQQVGMTFGEIWNGMGAEVGPRSGRAGRAEAGNLLGRHGCG